MTAPAPPPVPPPAARPGRDRSTVRVFHADPLLRRTLAIDVRARGPAGEPLDVPVPVRVVAVTLRADVEDPWGPSYSLSRDDGTLGPASAEALLREFRGRLADDEHTRRWLVGEAAALLLLGGAAR